MKVKVELTENEIRHAIKNAILEKIPELEFYQHEIKLEGSVKFKKKSVRKLVQRFIATVETSK